MDRVFQFLLLIHFGLEVAFTVQILPAYERKDPKVCGLQKSVDGIWSLDSKNGKPYRSEFNTKAFRFSFNPNTHTCEAFGQGGLGYSENSFINKTVCITLCIPWNKNRATEAAVKDEDPTDPTVCGLKAALEGVWKDDNKTGNAVKIHNPKYQRRYSFIENKNNCVAYKRSGLGNNQNSFKTIQGCLSLCRPWNYERSKKQLAEVGIWENYDPME